MREIKKKTKTQNTCEEIINKVIPNKGQKSVKFRQLQNWLDGQFFPIALGQGKYQGYGKTAKTRLIKTLKFRKDHGFAP
jgi:hypothetical protein